MIPFYLIYHPARQRTIIGKLTVLHDKFGGNEDPYIWNNCFLHTYCHITQLPSTPGQVNFWVSGDTYPNFTKLFCDCVFVVEEKHFWKNSNHIDRFDPIVESDQTFEHHYKWANNGHHEFKRRRRFTLKADPKKSFQPQDGKGNLIDILSFLNQNGLSTNALVQEMTSKLGSRPLHINDNLGQKLYDYLFSIAPVKLFGSQLKNKHPNWHVKATKYS